MFNLDKKWFAGTAIIIAAMLLSLTLFAQNQPKNNSGSPTNNSSWWNANVPEKYWLGDGQINMVNKIKTEYDELIQPEIEKLNSAQGDFIDYQLQDDISSKRIKEYQNQIKGIEDNIYSLKMEARNKIRKVLTNSQRVYFNDSRIDWWGGFYERCGWDYSDMGCGMRNHGYMDYGKRRYDRESNSCGCW